MTCGDSTSSAAAKPNGTTTQMMHSASTRPADAIRKSTSSTSSISTSRGSTTARTQRNDGMTQAALSVSCGTSTWCATSIEADLRPRQTSTAVERIPAASRLCAVRPKGRSKTAFSKRNSTVWPPCYSTIRSRAYPSFGAPCTKPPAAGSGGPTTGQKASKGCGTICSTISRRRAFTTCFGFGRLSSTTPTGIPATTAWTLWPTMPIRRATPRTSPTQPTFSTCAPPIRRRWLVSPSATACPRGRTCSATSLPGCSSPRGVAAEPSTTATMPHSGSS